MPKIKVIQKAQDRLDKYTVRIDFKREFYNDIDIDDAYDAMEQQIERVQDDLTDHGINMAFQYTGQANFDYESDEHDYSICQKAKTYIEEEIGMYVIVRVALVKDFL
jgi:hypothetical protein